MRRNVMDIRMDALQRRDDEMRSDEPSEAVIACCDLFLTVTAMKLSRPTQTEET